MENGYVTMIPNSRKINTLYSALLIQKAVPDKYHPYYRKWPRYYLDFCQNYGVKQSDTKTLSHVIKKLSPGLNVNKTGRWKNAFKNLKKIPKP
jgi:hypothetical protein